MTFVSTSSRGGSQPAIGQPKADAGTTYYGVPSVQSPDAWQAFAVGDLSGGGIANRIQYGLLPVTTAVTITDLCIVIDLQSPVTDQHATVATSAADTDWQPTGDVLYTHEFTIPANSPADTVFAVSGLSLALPVGLYICAIECDLDTLLFQARPGSFPGQVHCDHAQSPPAVIQAMSAPQAYGVLTTLPRWDTVLSIPDAGDGLAKGMLYPFTMKWS